MQTKSEKIAFLIKHAAGDATPEARSKYLHAQTDDVLDQMFQHLLQGERQRIASADPETQKAEANAAKAQQEANAALQRYKWLQICNTVINGRTITDCAANRSEVASWFDPVRDTQGVSTDWFKKILAEQPQLARRLAWTNYESSAEQQQHKRETDQGTKQILFDVCRRFNYSFSDANQSVVLEAFPNGLVDAHELETAIQNGTVHLHGADRAEVEEHTKAMVRAHNVRWANMSIAQIKAGSAQEKQEREAIFNRVAPEPKRHVGATPLPPALTAEVIRKADTDTIKMWIQRYSRESLNDRLSGVS